MTDSLFSVVATIYVTVKIHDPDVIARVVGASGDEWRSQFYPMIATAENVAEHLAFNAISNGVHDISRLDGWADLDASAATVEVDDADFFAEVVSEGTPAVDEEDT